MAEKSFSKESLNITQEKLAELKSLFPEVVSEGKIDFERLKLALGQDAQITDERYVLNWANKSDVFTAIQTPTTKTLMSLKEESVNFDTTQNVFIEGENLEALKVLQKSYYGKIKMIYIDPPYNTGNDSFIYPDKFSESKEEYLKKIKEKDEEGYLLKEGLFHKNSQENGQFHSNWLSMMYPRLFLAKNLLRDDGVIFVSIDDNEVHNLRLLMNEIFGEENFIGNITWEKRTKCQNTTTAKELLQSKVEYLLAYKKMNDKMYFQLEKVSEKDYPLSDEKGVYREKVIEEMSAMGMRGRATMQFDILGVSPKADKQWKIGSDQVTFFINRGDVFVKNEKPYIKIRPDDESSDIFKPFWSHFFDKDTYGTAEDGKSELKTILPEIGNSFETVKPSTLLKSIIKHVKIKDEEDCVVLDFFAGSGTTAQAVMELNKEDGGNRKFILVQLPEKTDEKSEAYKAGYKNIAEISKERIRRVIKKMEQEQKETPSLFKDGAKLDLGFKSYRLKESNFKLWRSDLTKDAQSLTETIDMFENPVKEGAKEQNILTELMLKSGYDLNAKVEIIDFDGSHIYLVNDSEHIFCLSKISDAVIAKVLELKPQKCLILDSLFDGKDSFKTNVALQMQDAQINLTVV